MRLHIRQKVFSMKDKFNIFDESGEIKYQAEGEFFSLGRKLHVKDTQGTEVILIKQKLVSFLQKYSISVLDANPVEIVKNIRFIKHEYTIDEWNIKIKGDFIGHNYFVERNGTIIATMTKEYLSWGDTYSIDVYNPADELIALSAVLVVDCCMENAQNGK